MTRVMTQNLERRFKNLDKRLQVILTNQVLQDSQKYIPMAEGILMASGNRHTRPEAGQVIWSTVYARRLYYNPQFNFRTDVNPNARGLWFEAAKSRYRNEWVAMLKKEI